MAEREVELGAKRKPKEKTPMSVAAPSVLFPRGRLAPPLPRGAPIWKRVWRALYRLGHALYLHDAFQSAPAMAFHIFLSLLPLLVFVGYWLGSFAKKIGVEAVMWPILEYLPPTTEVIVKHEVERMAEADTLGLIAFVGFLWIASGGTHGLMDALETVVGAPRRPWWKKRLLAAGWTLALLALATIGSFGVVKWDAFVHPRAGAVGIALFLKSGGERALALSLALTFAVLVLAGFYWFAVSHPARVKRRVFPGAFLAVLLVIVISWVFGLYLRTLASYAVFYGSLAAVAVLLIWLWLVCLAMIVGAELNAQFEVLRDSRH